MKKIAKKATKKVAATATKKSSTKKPAAKSTRSSRQTTAVKPTVRGAWKEPEFDAPLHVGIDESDNPSNGWRAPEPEAQTEGTSPAFSEEFDAGYDKLAGGFIGTHTDEFEEVDEPSAIVATGIDVTQRHSFEEVIANAQPQTITQMVDRAQKLLYLIDVSGSMNGAMASEDAVAQYKWTPEVIAQFRKYVNDREVAEAVAEDPDIAGDEVVGVASLLPDNELKQYVIAQGYDKTAGIRLDRDWSAARNTEDKITAVKGAMKDFVAKRFDKYPDAAVGLFTFDTSTAIKAYPGSTREQVNAAIEAVSVGGGTDIMQAVVAGLAEFKTRPSRMNVYHIVLVTDGEDSGARELPELLPQFKATNTVFDFLYISGSDTVDDLETIEAIKKVCTETGGEYFQVRKSSEFKAKFLEASNRLALPPAMR